jgi:hypothetical protein
MINSTNGESLKVLSQKLQQNYFNAFSYKTKKEGGKYTKK